MSLLLLRASALACWLVTLSWLVRYEAFPEYFTRSSSGYRHLIAGNLLVSDTWMKLSVKGAAIGYTHSSIDVNEYNADEHYVLNNRVHVAIPLPGSRQNFHALSAVCLDTLCNLRTFSFSASFPGTTLKVDGRSAGGNAFDVEIRTPAGVRTTRLSIPDDVVLASPLADTALARLKPGQELRIRVFDPLSMRKKNAWVKAVGRESLAVGTNRLDTLRLDSTVEGITVSSWVDDAGRVVRQETPFGVTLEQCTPQEAFDAALSGEASGDLLKILLPLFTPGERP